jgi:hypothetical protein
MTQVIFKSSQIPERSRVVCLFEDHKEAKAYAKRMRSYLTPGEKHYYRMTYLVEKMKNN